MSWHVAPSLVALRAEINKRWPNRDKRSDGTIGDAAHKASVSDHNPNSRRSVNAFDIDEDGPDMALVLRALIGDRRVNYVIYERTIYSRSRRWVPRPYYGSNPHDKHLHVSILQTVAAEQDTSPWGIATSLPQAPAPNPTSPGLPGTGANNSPTGGLTMSEAKTIMNRLDNEKSGLPYLSAQIKDVAVKDHAQFVNLQAQITDLTLKLRGDIGEVKGGLTAMTNRMLEAISDLASTGKISADAEVELLDIVQSALQGATITLGGDQ